MPKLYQIKLGLNTLAILAQIMYAVLSSSSADGTRFPKEESVTENNNQDSTTRPAAQEEHREDRPKTREQRIKWPARVALLALVLLVAFGLYRGGKWIAESRVARAELARTSSEAKSRDDQITQLKAERDGLLKASQDAMESLKRLQAQVDQARTSAAQTAGRTRQTVAEATPDKPRLNTHSAILTKTGG